MQFVVIWLICTYEGTAKKREKGSEEAPFRGCIFLDGDEDFFLLNDVSRYQKSCKSFTVLNSGVNYKLATEILYLARFLCIFIMEFSKMCIICWPTVLELRRKHRLFIFPYSSSFYQLVWIGMSWERIRSRTFVVNQDWIFKYTKSLCTTKTVLAEIGQFFLSAFSHNKKSSSRVAYFFSYLFSSAINESS